MALKVDPLTGDEAEPEDLEYADTLRNALASGALIGSPRPDGTWHISAPKSVDQPAAPESPQGPETPDQPTGPVTPPQPPPWSPTKYGEQVEKWRGTVKARMPASMRDRPDADMLVDKFLHVMSGESGGNPKAKNPESTAYGLMQDIHKRREDPESQIDAAWQMISKNPGQWTDWGEGVLYEGKPFGALGANPYGGGSVAASSPQGRIRPPGNSVKPPNVGDGGIATPPSVADWQTAQESILSAEQTGVQPKGTLLDQLRAKRGEQLDPEKYTPGAVTRPHTEDTDNPLTLLSRVYEAVEFDIPVVTPALEKAREGVRYVTAPVLRPVIRTLFNNYMGGSLVDLWALTDLPGSDFAKGAHNVKEAIFDVAANLPADIIPARGLEVLTTAPVGMAKVGIAGVKAPFKVAAGMLRASPDEVVKAYLARTPDDAAQIAARQGDDVSRRVAQQADGEVDRAVNEANDIVTKSGRHDPNAPDEYIYGEPDASTTALHIDGEVAAAGEDLSNLSVEDLRHSFIENTDQSNLASDYLGDARKKPDPDFPEVADDFQSERNFYVAESQRYGNELWRRTRGREGVPPTDYGNSLHNVPQKEVEGFVESAKRDAQDILNELDSLGDRLHAGEVIPNVEDVQKKLREEYYSALADIQKYGDELNLRAGFIDDLDGITLGMGNMNAGIPVPPSVLKAIAKLLGSKGPPRMTSAQFVADMRSLTSVMSEVVTRSDTPIVKQVQQALVQTFMNPSLGAVEDIAKAIVAMQRQFIAGDNLARTAIMAALDPHASTFIGKMPFKIEMFEGKVNVPLQVAPGHPAAPSAPKVVNIRQGMVKIASKSNPNTEGLTPIQEILENPHRFVLDAKQEAYVRDFNKVIQEAIDMMEREGVEFPRYHQPGHAPFVPHQANSVKNIELMRASNPFLERQYDSVLDGMAHGVEYASDPREIALQFVRQAYVEVTRNQFGEFLENPVRLAFDAKKGVREPAGYGVNPSELVPKPITDRLNAAYMARQKVSAQMQAMDILLGKKVAQTTGAAQVQAQKDWKRFTSVTRPAKMNAVRQDYKVASAAYKTALDRAEHMDIGPGALFYGMPDKDIPIGMWRNKYFPIDQAVALQKNIPDVQNAYVTAGGRGESVPSKIWDVTVKGTNLARTTSSGFDFGAPFIQGYPLLFYSPKKWAKVTVMHYASALNPRMLGQYMRDNLDTFQDMARYGVPVGDTEFFTAIETGLPLLKPLEYLPGGKGIRRAAGAVGDQTYGRMASSFNTYLAVARNELWKSITHDETFFGIGISKAMAGNESAKFVRNMTGGLETAGLGVTRGQRGFESLFLSFSPKFLRSTAALIGTAMQPNTPAGRRALRALTLMASGTAIAFYGTGKAMGMSDDELAEAFNPLGGRKFLSIKSGDHYYGIGGLFRALIQFTGNATENPSNLLELTQDNPLVQLYQSRSAPGFMQAAGIISAMGGPNLNPYSKVNNFSSYAVHLAESFLPFGAKPIVQGENPTAVGTAMQQSGLRVTPTSPAEKMQEVRDTTIKQMAAENLIPPEFAQHFQDWKNLSPVEQKFVNDEVIKRYPQAKQDYDAARRENPSIFLKISDEADRIKNTEYKPQFDKLQARLMNGESPKTIWAEYDALRNKLQGAMNELYHGNLGDSKEYRNSVKDLEGNDMRALWDKWNTLPEDTKNKTGGAYDFDKVQDARRNFLLDLDKADPSLTSRFLFNLELHNKSAVEEAHPLAQMKTQVQQSLQPYYNLLDSGADQRTLNAWMASNPDADFGNWFIARSDTPAVHSLQAAQMVLKTIPDKRDVHLAGTNLQITTASLPVMMQYEQQITQLLIMPRSQIIAGRDTNPVTTLRKNSPLNDALYFWLGFSKPDKGENFVGVYHAGYVIDFLKRVGPRSDGVRPRQIVN